MNLRCKWEPKCEPRYNPGDAGIDLRANIEKSQRILPGSIYQIPTGLRVEFPKGYCGLVLPRSSTGKEGLQIANTVPLIDPSYTGEIVLYVATRSAMGIEPYERFAQLLIIPFLQIDSLQWGDPEQTQRGDSSFGSTGKT